MHGGYATIGIENHMSDDGLQYTFNNSYASAANELDDETAIFITTHTVIPLPAPHLVYTPDNFDFTLCKSFLAALTSPLFISAI